MPTLSAEAHNCVNDAKNKDTVSLELGGHNRTDSFSTTKVKLGTKVAVNAHLCKGNADAPKGTAVTLKIDEVNPPNPPKNAAYFVDGNNGNQGTQITLTTDAGGVLSYQVTDTTAIGTYTVTATSAGAAAKPADTFLKGITNVVTICWTASPCETVGGIAEPVALTGDAASGTSGGSGPSAGALGAIAGAAAAAAALAVAGGWYARRRWVR